MLLKIFADMSYLKPNFEAAPFPGQFGSKAKMDSGSNYAASFSSFFCTAEPRRASCSPGFTAFAVQLAMQPFNCAEQAEVRRTQHILGIFNGLPARAGEAGY